MARKAAPRPRGPMRAVAIAVGVAALAGIVSMSLVPSRFEQRSVAMRDAMARAETAYARHRPGEAVKILQSTQIAGNPDADYMRAMLRYAAAAGEIDAHFALLHGPFRSHASPEDLRAATDLYTRTNRPLLSDEVLRDLVTRDAATPGEMLRLARALAARGETAEATALARRVAPRLPAGANPPDGVFVIKTLATSGDIAAARQFAHRWLGPAVATSAVLAVAPAIVEAGNADIAVDALRPRVHSSPAAAAAFAYAIRVAASTHPEIRTELTRDLLTERTHATGDARAALAHDLFAFGDFDLVRRTLTSDGSWRDEPLRAAFITAMRAHGQAPALRDLLVADARSASPVDQLRAARELADIGFAPAACAVLATLAAQTGPDSPALKDLMYLWRAHAIAPDAAWFEARAEATDDIGAARWVQRFAEATSIEAALELMARIDPTTSRPAVSVLRARYLSWRAPSPELRDVLRSATKATLTGPEANELFEIACAAGEDDAVRALAPAVGPPRTQAARACRARAALDTAHTAQRRGDDSSAISAYREAAGFDRLGSQDLFDFASALDRVGAPAKEVFEAALARLPSPAPAQAPRTETLRAALLMRLGRQREAQAGLERLVARNQATPELRTLLAELYVDAGAYQSALALTSSQTDR